MTEVDKALRYIFVLTMLLLFFVYFAGATKIFSGASGAIVSILRQVSGQNPQGTGFLAYPTGGPSA